jgi:hypothetical protein
VRERPRLLGPLGDSVVEGRASRLVRVLGLLGAACFTTSMLLWVYWDCAMPRHPDAAHGRVWELNTHGSVVYLTTNEHFTLEGLVGAGVVLGAIAGWRWQVERRKNWGEVVRRL